MNTQKTGMAKYYWAAILITAALAVAMHISLDLQLRSHDKHTELQYTTEFLARKSQRLSIMSDAIVSIEDKEKRFASIEVFERDFNLFRNAYQNYVIDVRSTEVSDAALLNSVLSKVPGFIENTNSFLNNAKSALSAPQIADMPSYDILSHHKNGALYRDIEKLSDTYEQDQKRDVDILRISQIGFMIGLFILLGGEIAFIFRPMERRIRLMMQDLEARAREAEDANRLKNDFLATMSHEIRSPMSGVLGMAELLLSTKQSIEQAAYTKTIISSGEALLRIIEDILDVSKIEAGKLELDPVAVDMLDLMDSIASLYSTKARDKAVELAVRYVPGTERFVYADPVRIRQVIGNLVDNAIKFTNRGYICLTIYEDARGSDKENVDLRFIIEDSGIGISERAQATIFDKFTQADSSTTRLYGGTGLGLSISRQLIRMMGGDIHLQSQPGIGTTFKLNVILKRNVQEARPEIYPESLRDIRILLVDDLAMIRVSLSEQLSMAGMRCDAAINASEAMTMMSVAQDSKDPYSIVLVDYLMPDMNGEMLARSILDESRHSGACLVLLTAAGHGGTADSLAEKGFSGFIAKPVSAPALIGTLALIWDRFRTGDKNVVMSTEAFRARESDVEVKQDMRGVRVLLAEDSRVNQIFVLDVLKKIGCETKIVSNGAEAVQAAQDNDYDIVLMDCQMPLMDGFEASRMIRVMQEKGSIKSPLPIIALTANAMKGDRQRCIDAGMDDYVSKPVRTHDLREKVREWVAGKPTGAAFSQKEETTDTEVYKDIPVIDDVLFTQTQRVLKDQYDLTLRCYIEDVETYIRDMRSALAAHDPAGVVRPAHTIKSSSLNMGAVRLSRQAREIEELSRGATDDLSQWDEDYIQGRIDLLDHSFTMTRQILMSRQKAA